MPRRKRSRPFHTTFGVLLALIAVLAAACGGSQQQATTNSSVQPGQSGGTAPSGPPTKPEKTTIKVGLGVVTSGYVPFHIAQKQGHWKKEGLEAEIVTFQGGSEVLTAVLSGSVDFAVVGLPEVATARQANQPVKAIYAGWNMPTFEFWAVPAVKTVKDLKGTRWGVTRIGSQTDFVTRYILDKNGYNPDKDVTIQQAGNSEARVAAMQRGTLDVNALSSPATFVAEELGFHKLTSIAEVASDFPYAVTLVSEDFIKKNPGTITSFLKGLVNSVRVVKTQPQVAIDFAISETKMDPKYAKKDLESWVGDLHEDGRLPSDKGMEAFWKMAVDSEAVKAPMPKEALFDLTWINSFNTWKP